MTGAIRGLAEIVLMVKDLETSLQFYRDVLGLETISPPAMQGVTFLRAGPPAAGVPAQIVLVQRPPTAPDPAGTSALRSRAVAKAPSAMARACLRAAADRRRWR